MMFLPIVDRELRVAARRRATYWGRIAFTIMAILTGCVIYLVNFNAPPQTAGQEIFMGLAIIAMVYCVCSGRMLTADCLSEEKREGTLGLLFLTDLKGYDVVLGKLVAASLGAFYGLLAVLPVLAVTLLMGGVTSGEFWRLALVLIVTFLFSLAIGISGSVISRDARRALAANFVLFLLLFAGWPLLCLAVCYVGWNLTPTKAFVVSPGYAFYMSGDTQYALEPQWFWFSIGLTAGMTCLLLAAASRKTPHSWQDKPVVRVRAQKTTWRERWRVWNYGQEAQRAPYRKALLDRNAFYWLAARARRKPIHVWVFLGLAALWWAATCINEGRFWPDELTPVCIAVLVNSTFKAWIAIEAGQQLAEDRKTGALELLLSTPLTVRDILQGQFLALRRQFFKPLLLVMAVEVILMAADQSHTRFQSLEIWLAGISMLAVDVIALSLVSLRCALTAKTPHEVAMRAISQILILPWALFGIAAGMINLWVELFSSTREYPSGPFYLGLWLVIGVAADLCFGLRAWRQLTRHFRILALPHFAAVSSPLVPPQAKPDQQGGESAPLPPPRKSRFSLRKKATMAAGLLGLLVIGSVLLFRPSEPVFPPPVVVSMTRSNTPIQVVAGNCICMVLPDGSLWQWGAIPGAIPGSKPRRLMVPERVENNFAWSETSGKFYSAHCLALRQDGAIFDLSLPGELKQIDPSCDWVRLLGEYGHSVALKRDGTLWVWGDQLVSGPVTGFVQVGTNADWIDVMCQGPYTMGIKTDGTLWSWGPMEGWRRALSGMPTQFCRETNWTGFRRGCGIWAQNRSGEILQPILSSGGPTVSVSAACQWVSSNSLPNHVCFGWNHGARLYEVRVDGTLWEKDYTYPPMPTGAGPVGPVNWRQMGTRKDWVGLWGQGVVIGLTADGMLWTWGVDPSQEATIPLSERIGQLRSKISGMFRGGASTGGSGYFPYAFQKEPRPLMRLIESADPKTPPAK